MDGEKATETTDTGSAKVKVEKIPTEEAVLKIKLSGSGMNDFTKVLNVKLEKGSASDLKVFFKSEDDNIDREIVNGQDQIFSTTKDKGKITVRTENSEMTKVTVNGAEVTLSDTKNATYSLPIRGSADMPVAVEVEFVYFKKAKKEFKVHKYANQNEFPLRLVSAKILSGDDDGNVTSLSFDSNKKASVELSDIRYSTVKLVMEFDQNLTKREVKKCTDQRDPDKYAKEFSLEGIAGTFSGYVTHDVVGGTETELKQIEGAKYTEVLITGYGTVSYEIEVEGQNSKKETYTVEIKNKKEAVSGNSLIDASFMKNITAFNGLSGRPAFYGMKNGFALPYYNKGSVFSGKNLNKDGFEDLAYMDSMSVVFIQRNSTEPYYFFYNIMQEDASKPKDEHKFKRIKARADGANARCEFYVEGDGLKDKYLDCFLSGKETLPNPMIWNYYGKKWRRTATKHGWRIALKNNLKGTWEGESIESILFFDLIFNYRVQAITYDNQHKTSPSTNTELKIGKQQGFTFWETGEKDISGWTPFLSGKTGNDKDMFILKPLFDTKKYTIKSVKYTIKCGDAESSCADVPEHKDKEMTLDSNAGGYVIGSNGTQYEFQDNKVYKVDVTVEYNGSGGSESETFKYIINYKDKQTIDLMDIADEEDADSNLFGVPTSYGVKTIDPAILKELANNSYTFIQGM